MWRGVDKEWERIMRDLRKKAIQGLADDKVLRDLDADFYRIVLRLTNEHDS
jgi:hypothetical protein